MSFLALFLLSVLTTSDAVSDYSSPSLPDDTRENCAVVAKDKPLSETDQQAIVDVHNQLRKSLETGEIKFKTVEWDDTLAGRAQMMADTCQLRHSYYRYYCPEHTFRSSFMNGQNYLRHGYNDVNDRIDFGEEVRDWWQEQSQYNYTADTCLPGKVCGHYLQMAWQKTYKVGCGFKFCDKAYGSYNSETNTFDKEIDNQFFFVCNYYPLYLNPDIFHRTSSRPYGPGCLTTPGEEECNNNGDYDSEQCECTCKSGYHGKWCEFQGACEDNQDCSVPWLLTLCNDQGFMGDMTRDLCPKTCGVC